MGSRFPITGCFEMGSSRGDQTVVSSRSYGSAPIV